MLGNTLTFTVNGSAVTLTRIRDDNYSSEYRLRTTTDEYRAFVRNSNYADKKRPGRSVDRHQIEFTREVFPVAPATVSFIRKSYLTLENDKGDSVTEPVFMASALCNAATASTNALLTSVINNEA
ncbi:TPA_asm: coat protein [ssRNA phage Zoerhiza.4_19]|uniref:Coat protein n=2 Tax=Leviviricetes TaxID=2842243 RepID=A0A8S5KZG1_9VIRU|nr:coat protein [ssRNA phage Zoerhiza.4_19]QDH89341.1 MAG: hypothetical protein H4Rhizo45267_000002 [Leviviridae sp.]DAD50567.1 TPA_asm: coat protein [ssRNA phage Zoerhiza.4_19]